MRCTQTVVFAAVEGPVDEAVVRAVIAHAGGVPGPVYGKKGKGDLRNRIRSYNHAARLSPWVIVVDLDHEADCPPGLVADWMPDPAPHMCFRVAVRTVESWLMADAARLAAFLKVSIDAVPTRPEQVEDPKETMVNLARRSRSRDIRLDMVPRSGSGRKVGPAYGSRLVEFVEWSPHRWRPDVAAERSESLRRCIAAVETIVRGGV